MKKLSKLLFSITALVVSAFAISGNTHSSNLHSFEETPTNEASRGLAVKLAQIDTEEEVSVSKTYIQNGEDAEGNHHIRYVTAFKGDVKGLQYVRTCKDLGEDQQTATKTVTTVYKGVVANGETQYYNGTDFDTNPDTEYYLACYQIKIKAESYETYKHHRWEVSLQVDTDGDITTIEHATDSRTGILEKITPEITFNNPETGLHYYSTDLDWMHNVPSDAEYVVTYDCSDAGIVGATSPENNGKGWSQIIDVVENDIYKAAHKWSPWFYFEGKTNIEIRGFQYEDTASSVAGASNRNYAMDGNPETYLWVLYPQREDAYLEWTLDEPVDLKNIEILLGKTEGGDEFWSTLSVSADKKTYTTIGNVDAREKFFNTKNLDLSNIKYIRLTNNGCVGTWAAVREIIINAEEAESIFSDVTYGNFVGYQEGALSNLYDGNAETYVRFQPDDNVREDRYIKLELTNPMTIYAIQLLNGDKDLGDQIKGQVLVSSDDETYEQFGDSFDRQDIVNLDDYVMNVKYIKITSEYVDTQWTALREIKINETSFKGAAKSVTNGTVHGNNKSSYALDGDANTYAWYNPASSPSVFTIEYDLFEVQDINSIMILMGKNDSPADLLYNMTFYYSNDGENYTKINSEVESIVAMDYLYRLDEKIQARYIKVESDRPADLTNWIVIREFQVGMNLKLDSKAEITFSIEAGTVVAPGAPITYTVSDDLESVAQFDKNEAFYCAYEGVAPSEEGTYALVVTVVETETTKSKTAWVVFTVATSATE